MFSSHIVIFYVDIFCIDLSYLKAQSILPLTEKVFFASAIVILTKIQIFESLKIDHMGRKHQQH